MKKILFLLFLNLFLFSFSLPVKADESFYKELTDLRTTYSKTYELSNGYREIHYYNLPIHYICNGNYVDIDNSFEEQNSVIKNKSSNYQIKCPYNILNSYFNFSYYNYFDFKLDLQLEQNYELFNYSHEKNNSKDSLCNLNTTIQYYNDENSLLINENPISTIFKIEEIDFTSKYTFKISSNNLKLTMLEKTIYLQTIDYVDIYSIDLLCFLNNENENNFLCDYEVIDDYYLINLYFDDSLEYEYFSLLMSINNELNCGHNYIRDKYVTVGLDGFIDNNYIKVGIDPLQCLDESGNFVNYEYKGIYELSIPRLNSVEECYLNISKSNNNTSLIYNPTIKLSIITNKSYDDISGGNVAYQKSLVTTGLCSSRSYSFDITDEVEDNLGSNQLVFELEGEPYSGSYSMATFYGVGSASTYPNFVIITSDSISTSTYGNASSYNSNTDQYVNCLGYALNINDEISVYYPANLSINQTSYLTIFIPNCISSINNQGFSVRILNSRTSGIYDYERRIAVRASGSNTLLGYHFMKECSDGSWAHKMGPLNSYHFTNGENPDLDTTWNNNGLSMPYNFQTIYFAIREE